MTLLYLDFDYSEDDEGTGTWDAMASVTPKHLPALLAEIEQVLAWAHLSFSGRRGPVDEGHDWDYDLQALHEGVLPDQWHYDEATRRLVQQPGGTGQTRHTVTLLISGTPAFGIALREHFGID